MTDKDELVVPEETTSATKETDEPSSQSPSTPIKTEDFSEESKPEGNLSTDQEIPKQIPKDENDNTHDQVKHVIFLVLYRHDIHMGRDTSYLIDTLYLKKRNRAIQNGSKTGNQRLLIDISRYEIIFLTVGRNVNLDTSQRQELDAG